MDWARWSGGALLAATLAMPAWGQDGASSEGGAPEGAANATVPDPEWRHALGISGEPGYPEGFEHFDYVNPEAPQGGTATLAWPRGFDSLNPLLVRGTPAPGLGLMYESLLTPALDEQDVSAYYGLIAEAAKHPADYSSVTFRLDPEARWHDGEPIDAEDVIWSFETAIDLNPNQAFYYRNVTGAEETAPGEVTFTFDQTGNRELPTIMGQLLVLPKHWWAEEREGERRIDQTRLDEMPVGSGPYRIASIDPGQTIEYERVHDSWADASEVTENGDREPHPTRVGEWNFDRIAYEVFSEPTVAIQAFKNNSYDWKNVFSAKEWATDYEGFEALEDGRVVREEFPDETSGLMQAFVPNLRLEKFADPRVRRALNLAFDFETTQRTRFYGQYERGDSFYDRTELASTGLPEGRELEILREVAAEHPEGVPETVFTEEYENPVAGNARAIRENLREADRLLREAGWTVENGRRVKDGEVFTLEYLESSPLFEPIVLPWFENLRRLGIQTSYRFVDQSQELERTRNRDFDVVTQPFPQSLSPGNEQRDFWGSEAADRTGSRNVAGIKNPAVDALIGRIVFAPDRDELVAATRALDRVLLHNDYVIPQWVSLTDRTLRWDKFGRPDDLVERMNGFSFGWPAVWWYDEERAAALAR